MCPHAPSRVEAKTYSIGLKIEEGWIGHKVKLAIPRDNSRALYRLCITVLNRCWAGQGVFQVQVTALDPRPTQQQQDMFDVQTPQIRQRGQQLDQAVDAINDRYGELTLAPALLLNRSTMPNVIAPAWKPTGHRQTI